MNPRKQRKKLNIFIGLTILIIGVFLGSWFVLNSKSGSASITDQINQILDQGTKKIAVCSPEPSNQNKDSDNDGLNDWEENLWNTDPCQPDTDKDGYYDGEEVSSGYNPLKMAPGDELVNPLNPRPLPNNLTQTLSHKLADEIMAGKIEPITDESQLASFNETNYVAVAGAIQQTIQQSMAEFSLPYIPDEEIAVLPDNSQTAINTYGQQIVSVINKWTTETQFGNNPNIESEEHMFFQAIQNKNFAEIDKCVLFYQNTYEEIKKLPAPENIKSLHKEQLGIFWVMANICQSIKNTDSDPIKAMLALEQYNQIQQQSIKTVEKIINYLQ